jgi:hypothetical protein
VNTKAPSNAEFNGKTEVRPHISSASQTFLAYIQRRSSMTKLKLLSAGLIAAAMIATPAMARENHVAKRHVAEEANASAFFPSSGFTDGRVCVPAPRVGAFATAPWTGDNVPCEP